jgi:hypothetical protein
VSQSLFDCLPGALHHWTCSHWGIPIQISSPKSPQPVGAVSLWKLCHMSCTGARHTNRNWNPKRGLYTPPPNPHGLRADSVQSVDSPQTVLGLHLDRVLVDVLLDEPSMSELSPSQIHAESKDYMDTQTEHGQTPYGLRKA